MIVLNIHEDIHTIHIEHEIRQLTNRVNIVIQEYRE